MDNPIIQQPIYQSAPNIILLKQLLLNEEYIYFPFKTETLNYVNTLNKIILLIIFRVLLKLFDLSFKVIPRK